MWLCAHGYERKKGFKKKGEILRLAAKSVGF